MRMRKSTLITILVVLALAGLALGGYLMRDAFNLSGADSSQEIRATSRGRGALGDADSEAASLRTVAIPVEGMSCVSCVASVTRALNRIEGVSDVEVSLEDREAKVIIIEGKVQLPDLGKAIEEAGYKPGEPVETGKP